MVIFAGTNGYADQVPVDKMAQWQADLIRFMDSSYPEIGKDILGEERISSDDLTLTRLRNGLETFIH